jgi:hypothetical protein
MDLLSYLQDLEDGRFIQSSLESVFLDEDGKQLLVIKRECQLLDFGRPHLEFWLKIKFYSLPP